MALPYTDNKLNLFSPPNGSYAGSWDQPLLSNWYAIDGALGGTTSITLSNSNVTLVEGEFPNPPGPGDLPYNPAGITNSAQNIFIALTGTLTGNVSVNLPAGRGGIWIFYNGTTAGTNNYTVSVKSASPGSDSIVLPNGKNSFIASNGYTVGWADNGNVASNAPVPAVATDTVNGVVKQGLLSGNCVQLNSAGKTPYQTDKYIISTSDPDPAQGDQNWLWFKV